MTTAGDRKRAIDAQFGRAADLYAVSEHRGGGDLELMVAFGRLAGDERLIDIATGAGHTALRFAPQVREVVATDLADAMVDKARDLFAKAGYTNVRFEVVDAQSLPFPDESFDLATCRIAPHHFEDIDGATREVARVVRPGGRYVVADSMSPDDSDCAAFLHEVEVQRDRTHVRAYTLEEWCSIVRRAGLRVEAIRVQRKRRTFDAWLERGGVTGEEGAELERRFREAPAKVRAEFEIEVTDGRVTAFADDKIVLAARRQ